MADSATKVKSTANKAKKHQFGAETGKVLKLMINSLYTNRDIFLRELISNASDACDKLRYKANQDDSLLKDDPELNITLYTDPKAKTLTITDNGVGMNEEDLIENLGTIARSGTQLFTEQLTGDKEKDVALIGQFGVGFYSAFMVADRVVVVTKKAGEDTAWQWESDGQGEYTVEPFDGDAKRGTSITLHLRDDEQVYTDEFRLQHIVKTYSDHISFPIRYFNAEKNEFSTLNKGSAIWARSKEEITEEQYQEFYKHVSHLPDKPWMTLHNKVEGAMEYTSLLYIPSMRPFDLFHPDRMRRVKLYVKRVFITEEQVDLIPQWLRFLRGVVDSEDLPLNISRETLQHNVMLEKIQRALTKRVLGELKKKAKNAPEEYAKFWENFGAVIKEGLCEALTDKEPIMEICRFHSTHDVTGLTGLDDYVARMPEGQEGIYYLSGEEAETLQHSPQLEGFKKRGYEVIFFTDHVDTFWTNVVNEYKGKPLISVIRAKLPEMEEEEPTDEKAKEEKAKAKAAMDTLIEVLKSLYGEEVKDVRTTQKLSDSPVCLAVGEADMDIRMERFLVENNQLQATSAKILELNPEHPIVTSLASRAEKDAESDDFKDYAWLLLDQARILEGEELKNPAAFAHRMTKLMAG